MSLRLLEKNEDARGLAREGVEVWKETSVPGYWVSNLGRLVSGLERARPLAGSMLSAGYKMFVMCSEGRRINETAHRLVVKTFDGEAPTVEHTDVRHLNGQKTDNRLCNLLWGTRSENMLDVYTHKGAVSIADFEERNKKASYYLSEDLVRVGLEFHAENKLNTTDLSRLWKVTLETAGNIVRGETWLHVSRPAPVVKRKRTAAEVEELKKWASEGLNAAKINELLPEGRTRVTAQDVYYYKQKAGA